VRRNNRVRRLTGIHIDMTPMVDIMMLLVIFFMMSTTFLVTYPGLTVNLPKATQAQEQNADHILIVVGKEGQIAIADQMVSLEEMTAFLRAQAARQPLVYIQADKDVSHGRVVEVMDVIRRSGISRTSIAIEPGRK